MLPFVLRDCCLTCVTTLCAARLLLGFVTTLCAARLLLTCATAVGLRDLSLWTASRPHAGFLAR